MHQAVVRTVGLGVVNEALCEQVPVLRVGGVRLEGVH
jgi:hypothetical protein